jgi:hypothetical protein
MGKCSGKAKFLTFANSLHYLLETRSKVRNMAISIW